MVEVLWIMIFWIGERCFLLNVGDVRSEIIMRVIDSEIRFR